MEVPEAHTNEGDGGYHSEGSKDAQDSMYTPIYQVMQLGVDGKDTGSIEDLAEKEQEVESESTGAYRADSRTATKQSLERWVSSLGLLQLKIVELSKKIGKGAFGDVYRGVWRKREVAVKAVQTSSGKLGLSKDQLLEALGWELSQMARVSSPNIVQFYGVTFCPGDTHPSVVMELCSGGELGKILSRAYVAECRLHRWSWELSQGLQYLHTQGMLHRDIKAETVLIDDAFRAKLADLGVAGADELIVDKQADAVEIGLQDLRFISPEKLDNLKSHVSTKADDIYAFGLLLWQVMSRGKVPRNPTRKAEVKADMERGVREEIPKLTPERLRNLIRRCWSCKPETRPSAEEVSKVLFEMMMEAHPFPEWSTLLSRCRHHIQPARFGSEAFIFPNLVAGDLASKGRRTSDDPLGVEASFSKFLSSPSERLLLLFGSPGAGKTTLASWLTRRLSDHASKLLAECENAVDQKHRGGKCIEERAKNTSAGRLPTGDTKATSPYGLPVIERNTVVEEDDEDDSDCGDLYGSPVIAHDAEAREERSARTDRIDSVKGENHTDDKSSNENAGNSGAQLPSNGEYASLHRELENGPSWIPLLLRDELESWKLSTIEKGIEKTISSIFPGRKESLENCRRLPLLVILDGYDECEPDLESTVNLPTHIDLEKWPNAKLLVTCRSYERQERGNLDMEKVFAMQKQNVVVFEIQPFTEKQIAECILRSLDWSRKEIDDFRKFESSDLHKVLSNPQVLNLFIRAWPVIQERKFKHLNRWRVFECYLEYALNKVSNALPPDLDVDVKAEFNGFANMMSTRAVGEVFIRRDIAPPHQHPWLNIHQRLSKHCSDFFDRKRKERGGKRAVLSKDEFICMKTETLRRALKDLPLVDVQSKDDTSCWRFTHHSLWAFFLVRTMTERAKSWRQLGPQLQQVSFGRMTLDKVQLTFRHVPPSRPPEDTPLRSPAVQSDETFLQLMCEARSSGDYKLVSCVAEALGKICLVEEKVFGAPMLMYTKGEVYTKIRVRSYVAKMSPIFVHFEARMKMKNAREGKQPARGFRQQPKTTKENIARVEAIARIHAVRRKWAEGALFTRSSY